MAEEQPSIHIDTDWKKQAQAEKKKLAEEAAARKAATPPAAPPSLGASATPAAAATASSKPRARGQREIPVPGFATLVQSLMTQVLYYLGDLATSTGQGPMDLDMARYQLDTLSMLEEKTANNLTPEETRLLDAALYETRTRFVSVGSQLLGP